MQSVHKFVSFDLEFDALLPHSWTRELTEEERNQNVKALRIVCGAAHIWNHHSHQSTVTWTPHAGRDALDETQINGIIRFLLRKYHNKYIIVTWGGTATDWRVLASQSSLGHVCRFLAPRSVDIPMLTATYNGMMMGLQSIRLRHLEYSLFRTKPKLHNASSQVPSLWKTDQIAVLQHVVDDARLAAAAYWVLAQHGLGTFATSRGKYLFWCLPRIVFRGKLALQLTRDTPSGVPSVPCTKEQCIAWI